MAAKNLKVKPFESKVLSKLIQEAGDKRGVLGRKNYTVTLGNKNIIKQLQ